MKKLLTFISLIIVSFNLQSQTFERSWEFNQLFGTDDTLGTTHLFYNLVETRRYFCTDEFTSGVFASKSANFRHLNINENSDSTFNQAYGLISPDCYSSDGWINIYDFHSFDRNFENYLFVGSFADGFEPYGYSQIGSQQYYLAPLFETFTKVEANPYLGKYFFLPRYDDLTVRVPITSNKDTLDYINQYWYEIYNGSEIDSSILKPYDFSLISLTRFKDSLAIISQNGVTLRSEDFGITSDTLNIAISENSKIFYDADSLHIYAISTEKNLLVSNNYGKPGSWVEKQIPFDPKTLKIDPINKGVLFGSKENILFKSYDFGSQFLPINNFDFEVIDFYVKPASEVIYVLSKNEIFEIIKDSLRSIKQLPTLDTISINFENFPYASDNEFVFTIRKREQISETSYKWTPIDEFHNSISLNGKNIDFVNHAKHPFLERITITEESQIVTNSLLPEGNWTLLTDSLLQYSTWQALETEDSLFNFASYGDPHYAYFDGKVVDKGIIINYFQTTDSTQKYGSNLFTAYWSPTLGFTRFIFNEEEIWVQLKGAVINGIEYGNMEVIQYVSSEVKALIPTSIKLHQNYPNPFNPSTTFSFELDRPAEITLTIFDALGRIVTELVDEQRTTGLHEISFDASSLSSGIYFYRLEAEAFSETKRFTLIK